MMTVEQAQKMPGDEWRAILGRDSLDRFASAFVRNPVLEASVANAPLCGAAAIRTFFLTAAAIYENIAFTTEANLGQTTFLEWKGRAFGQKPIEGLTVLAHDATGLIERIDLYHRPLSMVLTFSEELERRLGKSLGANLFAPAYSK